MNKITSVLKNALNMSDATGQNEQEKLPNSSHHSDKDCDVKQNVLMPDEPQEMFNNNSDCVNLQQTVYDLIRGIQDPEKPNNLEDLNVVNEEDVFVKQTGEEEFMVKIVFVPTVPHCSLAPLIGLCVRTKLERCLTEKYKLDIFIKKGTHSTADEINKQINDKERIAAAMENPNLKKLVDKCIEEEY